MTVHRKISIINQKVGIEKEQKSLSSPKYFGVTSLLEISDCFANRNQYVLYFYKQKLILTLIEATTFLQTAKNEKG